MGRERLQQAFAQKLEKLISKTLWNIRAALSEKIGIENGNKIRMKAFVSILLFHIFSCKT